MAAYLLIRSAVVLSGQFGCHRSPLLSFIRLSSCSNSIGFVGLGNMGGHMAANLAKSGFRVQIFDVVAQRMDRVIGEACAASASNMVKRNSLEDLMQKEPPHTVITMLPASPQVLEVYNGLSGEGLISMAVENTIFIDCTTGDPAVARQVSEHANKKSCLYIDAPVSGGISAAQQGILTFMVGGDELSVDSAKPYLNAMGRQIFHCGPIGTGLAAKICNNMLLAISMIGTCEALELGRRLGLEPAILTKIINNSSGRCWSSEVYNPVPDILPNVPSSKNYSGGFACALMAKDLGLAQNASTTTLCPSPLGSLSHQLYRLICQHGYASKDFSSIYEFLSRDYPHQPLLK